MMLVPVYAFLQGDTLGLVVLVQDHHTALELANNLMQAAAMRMPALENPAVYFKGKRLEPHTTVAQAGIVALDRVDVGPQDADDGGLSV